MLSRFDANPTKVGFHMCKACAAIQGHMNIDTFPTANCMVAMNEWALPVQYLPDCGVPDMSQGQCLSIALRTRT